MFSGSIRDNKEQSRFEVLVNDEWAYLEYNYHHGALVLIHTFVPVAARGQGISTALSSFALHLAKEKKLKVIVYCPFVKSYLKAHPEYEAKLEITYKVNEV
jgi:hypothetical protein